MLRSAVPASARQRRHTFRKGAFGKRAFGKRGRGRNPGREDCRRPPASPARPSGRMAMLHSGRRKRPDGIRQKITMAEQTARWNRKPGPDSRGGIESQMEQKARARQPGRNRQPARNRQPGMKDDMHTVYPVRPECRFAPRGTKPPFPGGGRNGTADTTTEKAGTTLRRSGINIKVH